MSTTESKEEPITKTPEYVRLVKLLGDSSTIIGVQKGFIAILEDQAMKYVALLRARKSKDDAREFLVICGLAFLDTINTDVKYLPESIKQRVSNRVG
jgi:hypothetical protein